MKVLIPDKVNKQATEILEKAGLPVANKPGISVDDLIKIVPEYDAIIVRSGIQITKEVIAAAKNLKVIGRAGVGVDNIDLEAAKEKGIAVMNTPLGNVNAAAEHTLTLLMMLAKHIIHSHIELKKGIWDRKKYQGIELRNRTLGIIGLGHVGKKVAKVAKALEMKVICFDPYIDKKKMDEIGVEKKELNEVIKEADFITIHVPKTKETTSLINKEKIAMMKNGVRILNVARGGIINEKDLCEAIKSGKVAAAAIDVWEQEPPTCRELIALEQVISTPHLGASTIEAQENVAADIAYQIADALKNKKLVNVVNGVDYLKE